MSKKQEAKEKVDSRLKLLGLIMPYDDYFMSYFEKLPEYFTMCGDFRDFYRLKKGKRTYKKENYEINDGMEYLIYSPNEDKYYYKVLNSNNNMNKLLGYFKKGLLFIHPEQVRERIDFEEEEKDDKKDDDYIIF